MRLVERTWRTSVTSVGTFLFFARKAASFYFAFPIMRLFGPLVLSCPFHFSLSRSLPWEVLFLRGRRSPSRPFSFLARRFPVSLPSFLHLFALFHLRFSSSAPLPLLSINLFFSLRSSGPRNEQRKSIGWHCGFVPSTVVLDLYIGTIYGTCFIKLKSLLCWDVFVSVLKYSFVPLNFVEIVGLVILINYCNYKIICSVYNYFNLQNKRR